ncbi:fumarylacetoacetate hydrolase family protein [Orbus wheelerorum]|uniref:fumarylacetoacetate hydrolase family protein n=1 Tax=Orbus wheelerorum TaxID=3074111 RepID=UPI00370D5106
MRLLRYGIKGQEKPAILDEKDQVRDLSSIISDIDSTTLNFALINKLQQLDLSTLPIVQNPHPIAACIGKVGKFICIGLNYKEHAKETGAKIPQEPIIFNKWTSAISGANDDVLLPRGSTHTDWEVELGVVIGKAGKYIAQDEALSYVAGYCVVNDISEREYQSHRGGTWDKGKGCDTFGPIGPWLVTYDEIADPQKLELWLEVDGKRYQHGNTDDMIFSVKQLISYVSQFMSLQPGDIISTGTPSGVGLGIKPDPIFLKAGQIMRLGIEKLGIQQQRVISED